MMRSDLAVSPRDAEIVAFEFDHSEGLSNQIDSPALAEKLREPIVGDAVDFNIEILRIAAKQRIANRSAHDEPTESARMEVANNLFQVRREREHQQHCRCSLVFIPVPAPTRI